MTKRIRRVERTQQPCKGGGGELVRQEPGAGRPRQWIDGHRPGSAKVVLAARKCACGCGLDAVRLYGRGGLPKYFPGHSPTDRKFPWRANKR